LKNQIYFLPSLSILLSRGGKKRKMKIDKTVGKFLFVVVGDSPQKEEPHTWLKKNLFILF
jgi:hypothetical protein